MKFYIATLIAACAAGGLFLRHMSRQNVEIAALRAQNASINAAFFASLSAQKTTDTLLADREKDNREHEKNLGKQLQTLDSALYQTSNDWATVPVPDEVLEILR